MVDQCNIETGGDCKQSQELVRVKEEHAEPPPPHGAVREPRGGDQLDCHQRKYLLHIKEETEKTECCDDSLALKDEISCPDSVGCGVSEEAKLAGLYTDHEVKDELVLGPEHTHQPDVGLVVLSWAIADEDGSILTAHEPHQPDHTLRDCCVRLERVPHVEALVNQQTDTQEDTNTDTDLDSDAKDDILTKKDCEKNLCDLCGVSFSLKSDLLEHIMIHIYKPEQEESVYGASEYAIGDAGESKRGPATNRAGSRVTHSPLDCFVRLERDPHVETLLFSNKHTTKQDVITSTYADSESGTEEDLYTRVDLENGLMCDICGLSFTLKSDLIDHVMIHIHVPTSTTLHQSRETSDAQAQGPDIAQYKSYKHIIHNKYNNTNIYVCDACGITYQQKYLLIRHIQNRHLLGHKTQKHRKSGSCYICGKHYMSRSYLKIHYRTHTGEKPYECDICQKRFGTASVLNTHKLLTHNNSKLFSCVICQKKFNTLVLLRRHKRTHTVVKVKTFECKICSKIFPRQHHLIIHERVHTGEKPYQCKLCGKNFSQSSCLSSHTIRIHTEDRPHQCEICDKRFKTKLDLNKHILVHTGRKPYTCYLCQRTYKSSRTLKAHKLSHTGVSCKICKKMFTSLSKLRVHKLIHAGGNIISCEVCDKKFIYSYDLKQHEVSHTKEKPFSCFQCDKRYSRPDHLKRHMQQHLDRPFACNACGKGFKDNDALVRHERTHTREKPYSCDFCNKGFSQRIHLTDHKLIHTGIKPYSCDVCNKRFSHSHNLTIHKRIHTGIKPYNCDVCNKRFSRNGNLSAHKRIHTETKLYSCD